MTPITTSHGIVKIVDIRLTWDGYEFLAVAEDKNRWREALSVAGGGVTLHILKEILTALTRRQLGL